MRNISENMLALDLAGLLGWAANPFDSVPRFGSHQLPKTGDDVGRYIAAFDDWLQAMLDFEDPSGVIYEAPSIFMKTTPVTIEKLVGLATHTQLVCHRRGIRRWSANPSQVKKHFTGRGNAKKPDMVSTARRCGFKVRDDNEADAIAVWWWSVECFGEEPQKAAARLMLQRASSTAPTSLFPEGVA